MTQMPICNHDEDLADTVGSYFMSTDQNGTEFSDHLSGEGPVLVCCFDELMLTKLEGIVSASGYNPIGITDHEEGSISLERKNIASIIFDIRTIESYAEKLLDNVQDYCLKHSIPLLVIASLDKIDSYFARITYAGTEWILSGGTGNKVTDDAIEFPAEIITSLSRAKRPHHSAIFENDDEVDLVDLKKISADVERISRALAQLSEPSNSSAMSYSAEPQDTQHGHEVSEVAFKFRAQDQDIEPLGTIPKAPAPRISAAQVRDLIKARRLREEYFSAELFADPAWDMLLDLMAARLEDKRVSVSSLCIAAHVPPTTALRWIKTMTAEKIFQRRADTEDGRRVFIELSDESTAGMIGYFSMLRRRNMMTI